jgi:protein phosphatase
MWKQGDALYIPGNHCNKLYRYLLGRNVVVSHGLDKTLDSYRALPPEKQQDFQQRFMEMYESAPPYLILDQGRLVVAHAGIKANMIGRVDSRVWDFCLYGDVTGEIDQSGLPIRRNWAENYTGSAYIIYGHTPQQTLQWQNRTLNIDLGCVFGGALCALRYPEMEPIVLQSGALEQSL